MLHEDLEKCTKTIFNLRILVFWYYSNIKRYCFDIRNINMHQLYSKHIKYSIFSNLATFKLLIRLRMVIIPVPHSRHSTLTEYNNRDHFVSSSFIYKRAVGLRFMVNFRKRYWTVRPFFLTVRSTLLPLLINHSLLISRQGSGLQLSKPPPLNSPPSFLTPPWNSRLSTSFLSFTFFPCSVLLPTCRNFILP